MPAQQQQNSALLGILGFIVGVVALGSGFYYYGRLGGSGPPSAGRQRMVRVRTHAGAALAVSPTDGIVRVVGGRGSTSENDTFLLMPLASNMVDLLLRERTRELALDAQRSTTTRSGCKCLGFANAYGFGGYCHAWEETYQSPWCYVDETCPVSERSNKGSFGILHERCDAEVKDYGGPGYPGDGDGGFGYPGGGGAASVLAGWGAPEGCPCSGASNKHGYGAFCKAWEEHIAPGQNPWCYTICTAPPKSGGELRRGSFGLAHVDCVPRYADAPPRPKPPPPPPPSPPPPPPPPKLTRRQKMQRKAQAHELAAAELAKEAAAHGQYVALVSQSTGGFVAVRAPPHKDPLIAVGRDAGLTAHSVFALLPSGHLLAMGPRALLALCAEAGMSSPILCAGYRERPREPHRRLLRSRTSAAALRLRFEVVRK